MIDKYMCTQSIITNKCFHARIKSQKLQLLKKCCVFFSRFQILESTYTTTPFQIRFGANPIYFSSTPNEIVQTEKLLLIYSVFLFFFASNRI